MPRNKPATAKNPRPTNAPPAQKPAAKGRPAPLPVKPVVVDAGGNKPATTPPTREAISAKAYEIWVAKGRPIGQDEQNWNEAEQALSS